MEQIMTMSSNALLDNIAGASQNRDVLEDKILRGAILRTFAQYIELNWACTSNDLLEDLRQHADWNN